MFQFAPENGLSDNERRYQGLLRKQRLELNYLLKDRERLLEAQQKLSALATSQPSTSVANNNNSNNPNNNNSSKSKGAGGSKNSSSQKKKDKVMFECLH